MRTPLYLVCATMMLLNACGSNKSTLDGSLGSQISLHFDNVRAYWSGSKLIIAYQQNTSLSSRILGLGPNVSNQVIRITLDSTAQSIVANQNLSLSTATDTPFADFEHYVVSSSANGGSNQDSPLPDLSSGTIYFEQVTYNNQGTLRGSFSALFVDQSTLTGTFDTDLVNP